jgi:hypothetical protein
VSKQRVFSLVYDLAGLSEAELEAGSIVIGGSARHVVRIDPELLPRDRDVIGRVLEIEQYEAEQLHLIAPWGARRVSLVYDVLVEAALLGGSPPPLLAVLLPSGLLMSCEPLIPVDEIFRWDEPSDGHVMDDKLGEGGPYRFCVRLGRSLLTVRMGTGVHE